jgi:hypothetical protein
VDALLLARTLAVANTAVDAVLVWGVQRSYDLPRSRRLLVQCALGAGYGVALRADDVIWAAATRRPGDEHRSVGPRADGREPATVASPAPATPAMPVHEMTLQLRLSTTSLAWTSVWWAGRGLPDVLRRRGVTRPNRLLAPPLALACAATIAPARWAHAHDRAAAAAGPDV